MWGLCSTFTTLLLFAGDVAVASALDTRALHVQRGDIGRDVVRLEEPQPLAIDDGVVYSRARWVSRTSPLADVHFVDERWVWTDRAAAERALQEQRESLDESYSSDPSMCKALVECHGFSIRDESNRLYEGVVLLRRGGVIARVQVVTALSQSGTRDLAMALASAAARRSVPLASTRPSLFREPFMSNERLTRARRRANADIAGGVVLQAVGVAAFAATLTLFLLDIDASKRVEDSAPGSERQALLAQNAAARYIGALPAYTLIPIAFGTFLIVRGARARRALRWQGARDDLYQPAAR